MRHLFGIASQGARDLRRQLGRHRARAASYWSRDKLHLNPVGHARVAGNVLAALGVPIADASRPGIPAEAHERTAAYWRRYVLPWIGRRLTGRSSGDNREPKIATLQPVKRPPLH